VIRIARNISTNISRNVSRSIGTEPDPVLERFSGASAAYSLYDLGNRRGSVVETEATYSNPAVRLRRDSDNTHKSFPAGAFTQMLNWTNEDVEVFSDPFTDDITGWVIAGTGSIAHNAGAGTLEMTTSVNPNINNNSYEDYINGLSYTVTVIASMASGDSTGVISLWDNRVATAFTTISKTGNVTEVANGYELNLTGTEQTFTVTFTANEDITAVFRVDSTPSVSSVYSFSSIAEIRKTSNAYATTWYDQSSPTPIVQSASENDVANPYETHTPSGINGVTLVNSSGVGKSGFPLNTTVPTGYAITVQFDAVVNGGQIDTISLRESVVSSVNRSNTETLSASGSYSWTFTSTLDTAAYLHFATTSTTTDVVISNLVITSHIYNDATQTTADNQPKVVDAGALVTDANGNYAPLGDGADDNMLTPDLSSLTDAMVIMVQESSDTDGAIWHGAGGLSAGGGYAGLADDGSVSALIDANLGTPSYFADGTPQTYADRDAVHASLHTGSPVICSITGLDLSYHTTGYYLFGYYTAAFLPTSKRSAILVYPSDANRSAIEQSLSNTITTALS